MDRSAGQIYAEQHIIVSISIYHGQVCWTDLHGATYKYISWTGLLDSSTRSNIYLMDRSAGQIYTEQHISHGQICRTDLRGATCKYISWTGLQDRSTYLLTYLCPSLPVEHRPSTTPRHRTLFWAALVIPDQLVPCCFSSASVSRLQLLRGRPLFLFPCGFQVRAWRVVLDADFLRVCPIQPHFLRSICLATGSCPARSHRSSFRIFSCHWIL